MRSLQSRPKFDAARFRAAMQYLSSEETRRLVDVLSKHPLVRTEDDLRAVDAFARHVPFFARLSPSQRLQLYRWCSLVELDRGSVRAAEGSRGRPLPQLHPSLPPSRRFYFARATPVRMFKCLHTPRLALTLAIPSGEEFFVIIEGEVRVFVRVSETRRLDDLRKVRERELGPRCARRYQCAAPSLGSRPPMLRTPTRRPA